MFFFKKSKPILSAYLSDGYHDIHNHLLFGIDDGAADLATSVHLFQKMQELGITSCIMTPHIMAQVWENTPEGIAKQFQELQKEALFQEGSLAFAAEYMLDDQFLKKIETGTLLTLKDQYVLIEMSYHQPPLFLYDLLFQLQVEGYLPVLAHPERYNFYHGRLEEYQKLKRAGCFFQLNLAATTGYYGFPVTKTAELILEKGWYDFTGTDVHHERHIQALQQPIQFKNPEKLMTILRNNEQLKR